MSRLSLDGALLSGTFHWHPYIRGGQRGRGGSLPGSRPHSTHWRGRALAAASSVGPQILPTSVGSSWVLRAKSALLPTLRLCADATEMPSGDTPVQHLGSGRSTPCCPLGGSWRGASPPREGDVPGGGRWDHLARGHTALTFFSVIFRIFLCLAGVCGNLHFHRSFFSAYVLYFCLSVIFWKNSFFTYFVVCN